MHVRAYRLELDGLLWLLLVDPVKFAEIPTTQKDYRWELVGNIDLERKASLSSLNVTGDIKETGYTVIRATKNLEAIN